MGKNSRKFPGQPWRKRRGIALGEAEKRAMKWTVNGPAGVVTGIV